MLCIQIIHNQLKLVRLFYFKEKIMSIQIYLMNLQIYTMFNLDNITEKNNNKDWLLVID